MEPPPTTIPESLTKVEFANLDKILFPQLEIKKSQVIEYDIRTAPKTLVFLADRPATIIPQAASFRTMATLMPIVLDCYISFLNYMICELSVHNTIKVSFSAPKKISVGSPLTPKRYKGLKCMADTAPLTLTSDVQWVGVNDTETERFEDLWEIPEGISYNSYLVFGSKKTALIDSVHERYEAEHLEKIRRLVDPSSIDYIVLNHMEPDHTGAVPRILELSPDAQVVLTPIALNLLKHFYHIEPKTVIVKGDDSNINLGDKILRFILTPWLHWPETMSTYLKDQKILFSCDAFGSFKRLPDGLIMEADIENIYEYMRGGSKKYFAGVFSEKREWVLKALEKFADLGIKPKMLAPSHGPVYNVNIHEILSLWVSWSRPDYAKKVIVAFGSMYGMTAKLVDAIIEGIQEAGGKAVVFDLSEKLLIDVLSEMLDAPAVMLGSPTYERHMFPKVKQFLSLLELKKFSDRLVGVFGSYGWSGEATRRVTEQLVSIGFRLVGKPIAVQGSPLQEDLAKAKALAKTVAQTAFSERGL